MKILPFDRFVKNTNLFTLRSLSCNLVKMPVMSGKFCISTIHIRQNKDNYYPYRIEIFSK